MVEVEQGPGAAAFPWRKRDKQQRQVTSGGGSGGSYLEDGACVGTSGGGGGGGGEEAGSLFTEPLQWMAGGVVGGPVQGKLYCPK